MRAPTPLFNEKVLCGLGRAIATTGKLGGEAVDRALAALVRFRSIARILEVKNVRAFATAAVREAEDGADFIARAEKACGMRIEVLSGEKEAKLVAHGIMMGFVDARRRCRRSRRRQSRADRYRLRPSEASLDLARRRTAADRCDRQQDREGAAADRRGDRAGAVARPGRGPPVLRRRRQLAGYRASAYGADELPAARHARLFDPDARGDRLLRVSAQDKKACRPSRASRSWPGRGAMCCPTARSCWSAC